MFCYLMRILKSIIFWDATPKQACLAYSSTQEVETVRSSETSETAY
jgi:hypothetical protein